MENIMVNLTKEEYQKLIRGNFTVHQCPSCDGKGWYFVDDNGIKRNPSSDENLDNFYKHECNFDEDDCDGMGFKVVYKD